MAVVKEYRCESCAFDFESFVELCPKCGKPGRRAFRTAPGYVTRGLVKSIDRILGDELRDRGLSDLPSGRSRKILNDFNDAEPRKPFMPGMWDKCSGSGQAPISPGWGKTALSKVNETYGTQFTPPVAPGQSYSVGDTSGPGREYIKSHTQIVARIDKDGNRIG
jgi:hypothetical protein